ncbi:MAG: hypothetical protein KBS82_06650 [Oscillospiraceae bacterium]|nr:hypothetical protein [Candidatus Limimonas egerieequi]
MKPKTEEFIKYKKHLESALIPLYYMINREVEHLSDITDLIKDSESAAKLAVGLSYNNVLGGLLESLNRFYFVILREGRTIEFFEKCIIEGLIHRNRPYTPKELYDILITLSSDNRAYVLGKFTGNANVFVPLLTALEKQDKDEFVTAMMHSNCDVRSITDLCYLISAYDALLMDAAPKDYDYVQSDFIETVTLYMKANWPDQLLREYSSQLDSQIDSIVQLANAEDSAKQIHFLNKLISDANMAIRHRFFALLDIEPYTYANELGILWDGIAPCSFIEQLLHELKRVHDNNDKLTTNGSLNRLHFMMPQNVNPSKYPNMCKELYEKLIEHKCIDKSTDLNHFMYVLGAQESCPVDFKPIVVTYRTKNKPNNPNKVQPLRLLHKLGILRVDINDNKTISQAIEILNACVTNGKPYATNNFKGNGVDLNDKSKYQEVNKFIKELSSWQ